VLDHPVAAQEHAQARRDAVLQKFSWKVVADGYFHLFESLVQEDGRTHE